ISARRSGGPESFPGAEFRSSLDNRKPTRVLDTRPILLVCKGAPGNQFRAGWKRGLDRRGDAEQSYQEKARLMHWETTFCQLTNPSGKHLTADSVPYGNLFSR